MKKDSRHKKFRAFVKKIVQSAQWEMWLNLYEVDIRFPKKSKGDKDHCIMATCSTDHRYYRATIKVYPEVFIDWKNKSYNRVTGVIVHEMCHILTDPLYKIASQISNEHTLSFIEDAREQLTQHISVIVMSKIKPEKIK